MSNNMEPVKMQLSQSKFREPPIACWPISEKKVSHNLYGTDESEKYFHQEGWVAIEFKGGLSDVGLTGFVVFPEDMKCNRKGKKIITKRCNCCN